MRFSNVSPPHSLQLFIKFSSVGTSHGVQLFRNRLLQCDSPMGSQAMPANLLRRGLLCPRVRRSWQEPAPAWGSPQDHSFPSASTCSSMGSSPGCRGRCAPPWTSMGCRSTACTHHGLLHGLQGNLCSCAWSTSSPSFFTDLGLRRVVSRTYSQSFLLLLWMLCSNFFPFLNVLSQRCYHHH